VLPGGRIVVIVETLVTAKLLGGGIVLFVGWGMQLLV